MTSSRPRSRPSTALAISDINPYERSICLQLRGRAYYETERSTQAVQDWQAAIATGAMLPEEIVNMRINIGQLLIANEQYNEGIRSLEQAVEMGGESAVNVGVARMLAQAYGQAERYRDGLRWAERFWELRPAAERTRGDYSLMLFYYQQLDDVPNQFRIIEGMVARWPTEKNNWRSYASSWPRPAVRKMRSKPTRSCISTACLPRAAKLWRWRSITAITNIPIGVL